MAEALAGNLQEWTVSGLSGALKRTLEEAFGYVRLKGEVSGYRGPHGSGHCYFALKDEGAKIEAVIWRTVFARLGIKPEEGLEVVATGRITTFPGASKYQIVIETIEPAGLGALMAVVEERRLRLAAEGLFDEARKRPLPFLPDVIGVITSPTGAVIRDILHRLAERFPRRVLLWPVRVQGETSAAEVAAAIRGFSALPADGDVPRPDVLIVARGGGSLEDLWSFNDEAVVRAAAASAMPLVSAIGHETDWTLIDHAADLRCPTPTGAAEKIVPVRLALLAQMADLARRHSSSARRLAERHRETLRALARALPTREAILAAPRQRLDHAGGALRPGLQRGLDGSHRRLSRLAVMLAKHSPQAELAGRRARFDARGERLVPALLRRLNVARRGALMEVAARLARARAGRVAMERQRIEAMRLHLARSAARLRAGGKAGLERRRARLLSTAQLVASLGYEGVLARGFALVRDAGRRPVRGVGAVTPGMALDIQFADGRVAARTAGRQARQAVGESTSTQVLLFDASS